MSSTASPSHARASRLRDGDQANDASPEPRSRSPSKDRSSSPKRRRRSRSRDRDDSRRRSRSRDRTRRRSRSPRRRSRSPERRRSSRDRDRRRSPERRRAADDEKENRSRKDAPAAPAAVKEEPKAPTVSAVYIPPARLRAMQNAIADKNSEQYQRVNWERLKKRIHGAVNKVNTGNLVGVVRELLQENIIRGKGLFTRSVMQAQAFSPGFSHVYAALISVINSKFPNVGELLLRRLVVQFKRAFRRCDKAITVNALKFIAHLVNQQVAHELLALEILLLLLETPTDDSVEVAIGFIKECGAKLQEIAPKAIASIFDKLRHLLQESDEIEQRVKYAIEVLFTIRKDNFQAYPSVVEGLDLIDEADQITHPITLEECINPEQNLNIFKLDPDFEKTEAQWEEIRAEIIGDADSSDEEDEKGEDGDEELDDDKLEQKQHAAAASMEIIDNSEQALVAFRRNVYLTIQSSLDYQEAAHKLLKMRVAQYLEVELCNMLVDCCAQQRTYEKFYGLLIERFCRLRLEFQQNFERTVRDTYQTIHRFDVTKMRNMARLTSHLLFTDAISWAVLEEVKLTEEDTTSAGRIYIKYIFQELNEHMGLVKLYERLHDPTLAEHFRGLFPRGNPADARFAINFFTLIGLGGLTVELRKWLEKGQRRPGGAKPGEEEDDSSDSSDDTSSSSSSSDSSESSSESSSSEEDRKKKKKEKKKSHKTETDKKKKGRT